MNSKHVLITGAASGIGRACAQRFAAAGYAVAAFDLSAEGLGKLETALPGQNHLFLTGNMEDPDAINAAGKTINDRWGSIDVLVHCAGKFEKTDPVSQSLDEWRKVFDLMVNGAFLITQLSISLMRSSGRIVHITSIHGARAEASASSYSMAKASINQYCRSLALELAPRNILVNAIAPGFVETAMSVVDGQNELQGDWFRKNYIENHHLPLKRAAQPEEIAGVAYFLAGPDATYITGQVLTVDGGLTITF